MKSINTYLMCLHRSLFQEYQYENSSLEAKIKEMQYMKDKEVEELNRKLE